MSKVLIAYITKTNSTKEVAEEIAKVIEAKGHDVSVKPVDSVESLEGIDRVVLGAPINGMKWHPDTKTFVTKFKDALSLIPTAYFSLSIVIKEGATMWKKAVEKGFDEVSRMVEPVKTGTFGGYSADPLPGFLRLIFRLPKDIANDQRDWDAIKAWAEELAAGL